MTQDDIRKLLWEAADNLRIHLDAATYKHPVLGLIFLKYVSDRFELRRSNLDRWARDPESEYFVGEDQAEYIVEDRDAYDEANVFWVPQKARWQQIRDSAKSPQIAKLLDEAMRAIERENDSLKGVLYKDFAKLEVEPHVFGKLIDIFSGLRFDADEHHAQDVFGEVYEYFLGQFALKEGQKAGQFYTPRSVVRLMVEILAPWKGRIYDPCMGSGGMFVYSEKFVGAHEGQIDNLSVYGQESNPATWRLACMNLAIRGIDYSFGKAADTFRNDQHPHLKVDYILTNPPFNVKAWGADVLADDPRWQYGLPPANNANYAWLQHMLSKLNANGRMGTVLANGSMHSTIGGEGDIRKSLVDNDLVECMVALPGQLFTNTQIPACLWFLARNKAPHVGQDGEFTGDVTGKVLFIDCRKLGEQQLSRTQIAFTEEELEKIARTYHNWRGSPWADSGYEDEEGFCKSTTLEDIAEHGYALTPGRYVGASLDEDPDAEPFEDAFPKLVSEIGNLFAQGTKLESSILKQLTEMQNE
jgi:type I restriction enzyme M protein